MTHLDLFEKPASLNENAVGAVHHDFADRVVENQVFDGFQERENDFESVAS